MENSELKTKKMSLANIEGKLSVTEMEQIMAGSGSSSCQIVSAGMCYATLLLLGTGPFACLAGATGVGCVIGAYAGCV
ncbi:MAG: hypothetical protein KA210_05105 [Bacteroidia bacterium]|nr:hypothetical protein [Bacteroidia bacterium]